MSRNNNIITSFFKPVPKPPKNPQSLPPRPAAPASPTPPPPSPSPTLPTFLSSSPVPAPTARDRGAVIRGSDDEDDDDFSSDDEFPPLFPDPPARRLPIQAPKKEASLHATPKAKRRALDFHTSPLTINTKHKFDIKALLKHAEVDCAIEESEQRADALLARGSPKRSGNVSTKANTSLHDTMLEVLSEPEGSQDEGNRERLLRAVKRTEATVQRKDWHFFDRQALANSTAIEARQPFPKAEATGVWAFLAPEKNRSEMFEDGLPFHVQCKLGNLPDEIFLWVLHEAPRVKGKKLRDEYLRLLCACTDQTGRLMDETRITELFQDVGASERALAVSGSFQPSGSLGEGTPCPEHDRVRLQTVLRILTETARALQVSSLTRTMAILLRLGIDNIVREDQAVAAEFQDALHQIVLGVPWEAWNSFCGDVCNSLYSHTPDATLRWNAVSSLPLLHPKLIDLRRRLALAFVFDDPRRAFSPLEDTFSMRSIIDRLDHADEFVVDRINTDYFELLALCEMLSVAVGDGCPPPAGDDDTSPEAIRQYNAEVDEVAHRIKHMWSNIHEQGAAYMSRLEVRVQLKDFERKLQHVVRTRPPVKQDIFGLHLTEEEVDRPRQQQFMRRFFAKSLPAPETP